MLAEPRNALIGRAGDVAAVCAALLRRDVRLLTITGQPGVGKTRLAVTVAREISRAFADGVYLVRLEAVRKPSLVLPAVAAALHVEMGPSPVQERLARYLADKQALLVLDNFEQVLGARGHLLHLLATSPELKILVTSRRLLRLTIEQRFALEPLGLPERDRVASASDLRSHAATALFLDRAAAAQPSFAVRSPEEASAVADICCRVEGLPLAIELAAARTRLLPRASALLAQLERGVLPVLADGPADSARRHRTMTAAIRWSLELLPSRDQVLFRRLAVFDGGFSLAAAARVAGRPGEADADVLQGMERLVDSNVVRPVESADEARFELPEVIREVALQELRRAGEAPLAFQRHADYFLELAESAHRELFSPRQIAWLNRLEQEHANLRAALRWTVDHDQPDAGARLAAAVYAFWALRGHATEGREWLRTLLAAPTAPAVRGSALFAAGFLAAIQHDLTLARASYDEALRVYRELQDRRGQGWALLGLARLALVRGDAMQSHGLGSEALARFEEVGDKPGRALALVQLADVERVQRRDIGAWAARLERALRLWREIGDAWGRGTALRARANLAHLQGDHARARDFYDEALVLYRELGFRDVIAWCLNAQGDVLRCLGDQREAAARYRAALGLFRELAIPEGVAWALHNLGHVALRACDRATARTLFQEALRAFQVSCDASGIAACLVGLGGVAQQEQQFIGAVKLFGAAETLLDTGGARLEPVDAAEYRRYAAALETTLGQDRYASARAEGHQLTTTDAIAYALEVPASTSPIIAPAVARHPSVAMGHLTEREFEIAVLVAQGRTNHDIARRLVVSPNTVGTHIAHILRKLGAHARAEIATWVAREHPDSLLSPLAGGVGLR